MKKELIELFKKKAIHKFVASTKPYGEACIPSDSWDELANEILALLASRWGELEDDDAFYLELHQIERIDEQTEDS